MIGGTAKNEDTDFKYLMAFLKLCLQDIESPHRQERQQNVKKTLKVFQKKYSKILKNIKHYLSRELGVSGILLANNPPLLPSVAKQGGVSG